MHWGESIRLALDALGVDKVKAFLTMLGVMIGSAAIVLVITIASTGKAYVVGQIEGIGANLAYAALDRNGVPAVLGDELSSGDLAAVRQSLSMVTAAAGTYDIPFDFKLRGKVVRINPDGSVPLDNPSFNVMGARREIYAVGFRNPYRFAAAPGDKLLVADVGEVSFEEVNLLMRGANYGWPQQEGLCNGCASVNPIYAYPHGAGAPITSVLVYTGSEFGPSYQNKVFIADLIQGSIVARQSG